MESARCLENTPTPRPHERTCPYLRTFPVLRTVRRRKTWIKSANATQCHSVLTHELGKDETLVLGSRSLACSISARHTHKASLLCAAAKHITILTFSTIHQSDFISTPRIPETLQKVAAAGCVCIWGLGGHVATETDTSHDSAGACNANPLQGEVTAESRRTCAVRLGLRPRHTDAGFQPPQGSTHPKRSRVLQSRSSQESIHHKDNTEEEQQQPAAKTNFHLSQCLFLKANRKLHPWKVCSPNFFWSISKQLSFGKTNSAKAPNPHRNLRTVITNTFQVRARVWNAK